jgi:integrase
MGTCLPYLQRRGGRFFFRIQVPTSLRGVVGCRELTRTLNTGERSLAVPLALELGAAAKHLFNGLRQPAMSSDEMLKLLRAAQQKLTLEARQRELEQDVEDLVRARTGTFHEARRSAEFDALKGALETALSVRAVPMHPAPQPATASAPAPVYATLGALVDRFLEGYAKDRKPAMFKKHQAALMLLKQLHGDKPINRLRQADVLDFFEVVAGLPPRSAEKCKKRGITARALAAEDHDERLGKKTFDDNYEVPMRLFLKWARTNWQDEGFPTTLTTEGVEFSGDDDEGKDKQRAMKHTELEQLFHRVLAPYRDSPDEAHLWWLPVLAFYTGARVNELCQLNPQTDLRISPEGINYVFITAKTEADERVRKSVKTGDEREVPLHPDLVAGGFIAYVKRVRESGSKLLFPSWTPINRRASTQAERWFRDLLRATGLRDETPGARMVGFHAFRHTLLSRAANSEPAVDAGPITGHTDTGKGGAQRGYEGERALPNKLKLLKTIQFGFSP